MSVWGSLNGTLSEKGLGVAFYKIPGGLAGIVRTPAASQATVPPSLLSPEPAFKAMEKRPAFLGKKQEAGAGMKPVSLPSPLTWQDWAGDSVLGRRGPRLLDPWCAGCLGPGKAPEGVFVFWGTAEDPQREDGGPFSEQVRILTSPNPLNTPAMFLRPGPPNLGKTASSCHSHPSLGHLPASGVGPGSLCHPRSHEVQEQIPTGLCFLPVLSHVSPCTRCGGSGLSGGSTPSSRPQKPGSNPSSATY